MPNDDHIVQCVTQRAAEFQGYAPIRNIETLQVVHYGPGQQYQPHYDWGVANAGHAERFSTFFVTLEANCTECGTSFPNLAIDWTTLDPVGTSEER